MNSQDKAFHKKHGVFTHLIDNNMLEVKEPKRNNSNEHRSCSREKKRSEKVKEDFFSSNFSNENSNVGNRRKLPSLSTNKVNSNLKPKLSSGRANFI
jgi:hypothetical protein